MLTCLLAHRAACPARRGAVHKAILHGAHAQEERQLGTCLGTEGASPHTSQHFTRILCAILQGSHIDIDIFLVVAQQLLNHPVSILHIQLHATHRVAAVEDAVVQTLFEV